MEPYPVERIIFVSPRNFFLGHFVEFLQESVPFGVGFLAGYMRSLGENVEIWDINVRSRSAEDVLEAAPDGGAGTVFGISLLTAGATQGYEFAHMIRKVAPNSRILFGGYHPTALPEEPLEKGSADAVVRAEGEETLKELLRMWREGEDIVGAPGISCRNEEGKIIHGPAAPTPTNLDGYPPLPYDMFDLSKYHLGMVLTSRGCPFDCIFCSQQLVTGRKFRAQSTERVVNELEFLVKEHSQPSIYFIDDMFNANPKRLRELCAEIKDRGLGELTDFAAQVRADCLPPDILKTMKEAGFRGLSFGIETGSEAVMSRVNKKEKVAEIADTALRARKMGFRTEGAIIFGFPEETFEDRLRGVVLAKKLKLTRVRFNNLTPYPGTPVFNSAKESGELVIQENWKNFNSAGATASAIGSGFVLPYVPENTTNGALQGEVLLANMYSSLSIRRIFKMITPSREPNGMGFELTFKELIQPKKIYHLFMAMSTIFLRVSWFLMTEPECRRFFWALVSNRLPDLDPEVEEVIRRHSDAPTVVEVLIPEEMTAA